jgi:hypothetical protein
MATSTELPDEVGNVEVAIDRFVDECRSAALWYVRPGYYPRTDSERVAILEAIQERCSLDLFRRAGVLKSWLSRHSNAASASS